MGIVLLNFRKVFILNRANTLIMKRYPTTVIDERIWKRFIEEIGKRKGPGRGVIQKSLEEAIILWIGEMNE